MGMAISNEMTVTVVIRMIVFVTRLPMTLVTVCPRANDQDSPQSQRNTPDCTAAFRSGRRRHWCRRP